MAAPVSDPSTTRRKALAAAAVVGAGATTGCLDRLRSIFGLQPSGRVTLGIKTEPPDADPYSLRIAREIESRFETAGIGANITPMATEELRRQVLLNQGFDVFVARVPMVDRTPDALHSLLHSTGVSALGWRNPFGYTNLRVDELLDRQRRVQGQARQSAVTELLGMVTQTQPFSVVAAPENIRTARTDRCEGWREVDLDSPLGYLAVERHDDTDEAAEDLRVVTTNQRVTENLNPLAVEFRSHGTVTGLLYDTLCQRTDTGLTPWLADSVEFRTVDGGLRATVRLRSDLTWHDDEPLTAGDVAFTYDFLRDTSLEAGENAVPTPRFYGRASLVESTTVIDSRTITLEFGDAIRPVARRAFTVPILPEHVWAERTDVARVGGVELNGQVTDALVAANVPAVGSGPVAFVRNTPKQSLVLERFDDHFLYDEGPASVPTPVRDGPDFERLVVSVVGSDAAAVEQVANGEADVTGSSLGARAVPRIGRESDLELLVTAANSFYLVGYNTRRQPLTNPRFRNGLGHLIDKAQLVETVFEGYARPATTLLAETDWAPADLTFEDADPVTPFFGSEGELDAARAREAFRAAGYNYSDDRLVVR
jgi:peptide/nickel transport system substrate-binding protein